jgi:2-keto-4-pentenoate hydratase
MQPADADRAAETIWQLWQRGEAGSDLPSGLKPTTRAEGYQIQACLERRSAAARAGWKIAATSLAGQQHIGVDGPLAGRVLAERVLPVGTRVSLAGNRMRVAEPEFAFRMARQLPPRREAYMVDEVMAAVGALHLAIELPNSRFIDFARVGGPTLIADNACAHELIVGPAVAGGWRAIDLAAHKVKARVRNRADRHGIGANVLGDPCLALTWIANELSALGIGLAVNEVVTTGTCMVPVELLPGDHIRFDYGALGALDLDVAPAI